MNKSLVRSRPLLLSPLLSLTFWRSKQILRFPDAPQDTLQSQLKSGVRYITTMSYGGHGASSPFRAPAAQADLPTPARPPSLAANQFMAIENLLYLAKLLSRVAIV